MITFIVVIGVMLGIDFIVWSLCKAAGDADDRFHNLTD